MPLPIRADNRPCPLHACSHLVPLSQVVLVLLVANLVLFSRSATFARIRAEGVETWMRAQLSRLPTMRLSIGSSAKAALEDEPSDESGSEYDDPESDVGMVRPKEGPESIGDDMSLAGIAQTQARSPRARPKPRQAAVVVEEEEEEESEDEEVQWGEGEQSGASTKRDAEGRRPRSAPKTTTRAAVGDGGRMAKRVAERQETLRREKEARAREGGEGALGMD